MQEADAYRTNKKLAELRVLEQVYTIGAATARDLHKKGHTTLETLPSDYNTKWVHEFAQK